MDKQRAITMVLAVVCILLVVAVLVLSLALRQRTRFVQATDKSPFIMFDRDTGEACWSGSAGGSAPLAATAEEVLRLKEPIAAVVERERLRRATPDAQGRSVDNPPAIPFCKDLK
jgi:hypothetical protein